MISVSNLAKNYGGQTLYTNGTFFIGPGEKIGLVGPNGAGKTSLFRLIVGEEKADAGQISFPDKLRIAYFSQKVGEMKGRSVLEEVICANPRIALLKKEMSKIESKLETGDYNDKDLENLGEYQTEFEQLGGYNIEAVAAEILTGLSIMPNQHNKPVEEFSGGWKMRVALAKVIVQNPDVLLMDEPTNYLDLESIIWLEAWLKNFKGSLVMTSHDRDFMNNIAKKIIEVNNKQITVYGGNYDFYEKEREIRRDQLKASFERQQDMLAKEEEFIAKFAARASHAAQVQSRVKKLDKIDRIEMPTEEKLINFTFPTPPRSGNDVVKINNLAKTYNEGKPDEKKVFSNISTVVNRLEKIAIVGVNGAGKSTLLKIVANMLDTSTGTVEIGSNVNIGYFSQYSIDVLHPHKTVFEELRDRVKDKSDGLIRNLLAAFLFRGDDIDKKVSVLSGGEKSRLILAALLTNPCNLLILDEPTNHLDIGSREVLLNALKAFEGTVLMVSHDRHFLAALATKVYEITNGGMNIYHDNFKYYLEKTTHLSH